MLRVLTNVAMAGERAGFTVEEMFRLLDAGLSIEGLEQIIAKCPDAVQPVKPARTS
jgi:hypothetical protein